MRFSHNWNEYDGLFLRIDRLVVDTIYSLSVETGCSPFFNDAYQKFPCYHKHFLFLDTLNHTISTFGFYAYP
jgi:hypothetical protein